MKEALFVIDFDNCLINEIYYISILEALKNKLSTSEIQSLTEETAYQILVEVLAECFNDAFSTSIVLLQRKIEALQKKHGYQVCLMANGSLRQNVALDESNACDRINNLLRKMRLYDSEALSSFSRYVLRYLFRNQKDISTLSYYFSFFHHMPKLAEMLKLKPNYLLLPDIFNRKSSESTYNEFKNHLVSQNRHRYLSNLADKSKLLMILMYVHTVKPNTDVYFIDDRDDIVYHLSSFLQKHADLIPYNIKLTTARYYSDSERGNTLHYQTHDVIQGTGPRKEIYSFINSLAEHTMKHFLKTQDVFVVKSIQNTDNSDKLTQKYVLCEDYEGVKASNYEIITKENGRSVSPEIDMLSLLSLCPFAYQRKFNLEMPPTLFTQVLKVIGGFFPDKAPEMITASGSPYPRRPRIQL